MDEFDFEGDGWSAVRVGPAVLGWVGPYPEQGNSQQSELALTLASVSIIMGDRKLPLAVQAFSSLFGVSLYERGEDERRADHRERKFTQNMLSYRRCFAVPVPADSLDVTADGRIIFTDRSLDALYTALYKFFTAFVAEVQSDLNTKTPIEVVRKFSELSYYNYPAFVCDALKWRGRKLNDISRGTTMQAKAIRIGQLARYPYLKLPGSVSFDSFVEWQTRVVLNPARILPDNVLMVTTSSPEEYELVQSWFDRPGLLEKYWAKIRPEGKDDDASFFLCQAGDVAEEWVDGETISMKEFSRAMRKLDSFRHRWQIKKENDPLHEKSHSKELRPDCILCIVKDESNY